MMRSETEIRAQEMQALRELVSARQKLFPADQYVFIIDLIDARLYSISKDAPAAPASPTVASMSDAAIRAEIASREKWERETEGEELGGGSPMERHYERLEELDAELKRRESAPASPTGEELAREVATLTAERDAIEDMAENVIIAYGMGLGLDEAIANLGAAVDMEVKPRGSIPGAEDVLTEHIRALTAERDALKAERDEIRRLLVKEEKAHERTIGERDEAQECVSNIYFMMTGRSPEWSNNFGYDQCLEELREMRQLLGDATRKAEATLSPQSEQIAALKAALESARRWPYASAKAGNPDAEVEIARIDAALDALTANARSE